jgi:hypothetical protein
MYTSEDINKMLKEVMSRLNSNVPSNTPSSNGGKDGSARNTPVITPSQLIVIGGLLGGALEVSSVLVDKNQTVEILLTGSLKKRTDLEKMLDQIGSMPFDEVVKAMLGRL